MAHASTFQKLLPGGSLITFYNFFTKSWLKYGDVTYDQNYGKSFQERMETIQYNAVLAVTRTIRRTRFRVSSG